MYIGKKPAVTALTSSDIADDIITEAKMANDAISLTELKAGTDGEIITWDASGNPAAVAVGTSGHFLKSQGAGSVPVFAAVSTGSLTSAATVRLTTDLSTEGYITSNWEVSDGDGYGALGSPPTESSGVWTFPSTGIWYVSFSGNLKCSTGTEYGGVRIHVTTNNASYDVASDSQDRIEDNTEQNCGTASIQFDVTDTGQCKVKFYWHGVGSNLTLQGASTQNITWAHFIRLGDT